MSLQKFELESNCPNVIANNQGWKPSRPETRLHYHPTFQIFTEVPFQNPSCPYPYI